MQTRIFREVAGGLVLSVRVTPKSSRNQVVGVHEMTGDNAALSIKVSAPPDKGKANRAVLEVLAEELNFPKSKFSIASGEASRNKSILIEGDPEHLSKAVQMLLQQLKS